jgi:hypothetical protein
VFVAETLSVIVQVGSFRLTGRRVFRCAPLHHHFQFLGWPESKVVVRFWIAAALCAAVGVSSLRISLVPTLAQSLVPTLRVGTARRTLCIPVTPTASPSTLNQPQAAERLAARSHAERGNEAKSRSEQP